MLAQISEFNEMLKVKIIEQKIDGCDKKISCTIQLRVVANECVPTYGSVEIYESEELLAEDMDYVGWVLFIKSKVTKLEWKNIEVQEKYRKSINMVFLKIIHAIIIKIKNK